LLTTPPVSWPHVYSYSPNSVLSHTSHCDGIFLPESRFPGSFWYVVRILATRADEISNWNAQIACTAAIWNQAYIAVEISINIAVLSHKILTLLEWNCSYMNISVIVNFLIRFFYRTHSVDNLPCRAWNTPTVIFNSVFVKHLPGFFTWIKLATKNCLPWLWLLFLALSFHFRCNRRN
jgi:hypothetical protein